MLLKRRPAGLDPMVLLSAMAALAVVMLAPFYGWELARGSRMAFTPATVLTVVYVALFASVIAFALWNSAVSQVGANRAGVFVHLHPLFTTVLAIAFLGEVLRPYHWVGIVLIFAGIYLTTLAGMQGAEPLARRRLFFRNFVVSKRLFFFCGGGSWRRLTGWEWISGARSPTVRWWTRRVWS